MGQTVAASKTLLNGSPPDSARCYVTFRQHMVVGLILAALQACAPMKPAGLTDADKAAIRAATAALQKNAMAVPFDAAVYTNGFYAADAVVMTPNLKALNGSAEIIAWLKTFPPLTNVVFTDVEIEGMGDAAWTRGTYTFTVNAPGAPLMTDSGKYLEIWKKQADGSWRVVRDAFNSDLPVAPAAPAPAPKKK